MENLSKEYSPHRVEQADESVQHPLRVVAVAAPHWPKRGANESTTLNSRVPFSLQNALRLAAHNAITNSGAWGESNWSTQQGLDESIRMYDYADSLPDFEQTLDKVRPNLLLIGAMTLSLPGGVELAKLAKERLGDDITVVLGGKHANETIYKKGQDVYHSPSSPLRLMSEGKIPPNFDVVVSGDGEYVITEIGELAAKHQDAKDVIAHLNDLHDSAGNWIVGHVRDGELRTLTSKGIPINYSTLPIAAEVFGFKGSFKVFDTERTAHVYSDISHGCIYNCFFCTERRTINGTPRMTSSAERLASQLNAVAEKGQQYGDSVSAFVEDSILLMGNAGQLKKLRSLLDKQPIIPFGGQITVPLFLRENVRQALFDLKEVGLTYLFTGLETDNEDVAESMSKNIGKKSSDWMSRNELAISLATEADLKYGIAVLFGIGESHDERLSLLQTISGWQEKYNGNPCVVSLNWATQHPLRDVGTHDYTDWGTPADSERLPYFQSLFGEASERYPVDQNLPTIEELREIQSQFSRLKLEQ